MVTPNLNHNKNEYICTKLCERRQNFAIRTDWNGGHVCIIQFNLSNHVNN